MKRKCWAGLDVGVETTSICVIDDAGEILLQTVCPTDIKSVHGNLRFLKRRRFARIALEASTGLSLARGLRTLGYSIDLYETRQLSKFLRVRRNKTDIGDAYGIAEAGRIGASLVSKVHLKSLECQLLQSHLLLRNHLIRTRLRFTNLLRRQLEHFGGRIRSDTRSPRLRSAVEAEIKKLFGRQALPLVVELRRMLSHCEQLRAHELAMDRHFKQMAKDIDICRRMMEIPGVGPICALTFYATIAEPHRFRRSSDIGPYLGLTPRLYQSGLTKRSGRVSKMGNVSARTLLVSSSMRFMKSGDPRSRLRDWVAGIELRRGRGRARVALARKLATIMLAMWKSGEKFEMKYV